MIRTWVYLICWGALALIVPAWSEDPNSLRLAPAAMFLLLLLPWVLDFLLARRSFRRSAWTMRARLLNVLPMSAFLLNVYLVWHLHKEPAVHHTKLRHSMAVQLVGAEVPILETWYSQDLVFTGHGSEYLRIRFPREHQAAVQAALANRCRAVPASAVRWSLLSESRPTAKDMPWDPPSIPVEPRICGADPGFQTDFGLAGDSLLLYYEGH